MKLGLFQHFSKSQNLPFLKRNQIFGFTCCCTRVNLSIHISITTDIDGASLISFLGLWTERLADTISESSFGNIYVGTQKNSTQSSKLGICCQSQCASQDDGDA